MCGVMVETVFLDSFQPMLSLHEPAL